jgi:hypothetical protein
LRSNSPATIVSIVPYTPTMQMMSDTPNILADYDRRDTFARAHGVSPRTVDRYRHQGLPWIEWGGWIWIHRPGAKKWLDARLRQSNRPRGFAVSEQS